MNQRTFESGDIDFRQLHEAVFPADVREGENLKASFRVSSDSSRDYISARVWRLSPVGVELLVDKQAVPQKTDLVDLTLVIGGQRTLFEGVVVEVLAEQDEKVRLGVRLSKLTTSEYSSERRRASRWDCSGQYHPTAVAQNPVKFNDYLYFKVKDISVTGLQLITSLRNKFIVPGMRFNLQASLPMIGQVEFGIEITRIGFTLDNGKDYLTIGSNFTNISQSSKNIIGQYLLQFGQNVSLQELKDNNFHPKSIASAIEYSFVKSDEDYRAVLQLRLEAYSSAGKTNESTTKEDMADIFDSRSRILIGKLNGEIVASTRLTYAELNEKLELDSDLAWHSDFPRREEVVEVSKTCTSPRYRGADVLISLFHQVAIASVQSKRHWIIIGATPDILSMYTRIGLRDTGIEYTHKKYNDLPHKVLLGHTPSVMKGIGVGPIYWHAVWKDVAKHLSDNDYIPLDGMSMARISTYKLLAPISWLAQNRKRRPRRS